MGSLKKLNFNAKNHTWVERNRVWLPKDVYIQDFVYPEVHVSIQVISNRTGP